MGYLTKKYWYSGYGATFIRDKELDIFHPNSFVYTLPIPVLINHSGSIIGYVDNIQEDEKGLLCKFFTHLYMTDNYLSIGFKIIKSSNIWYRKLQSVKIIELSIVANPAQFNTIFHRCEVHD